MNTPDFRPFDSASLFLFVRFCVASSRVIASIGTLLAIFASHVLAALAV
jgi:hypothetical protein